MAMYALRLDERDGVSSERVRDFLRSGGYDEYVVVHEVAKETGKPHFQGYVITEVKLRAYQARVRVAFPELVGKKGTYAASEVKDPLAYKRYIMKGTADEPPVVVASSIQLCIDDLWKESRVVEEDKARKGKDRRGEAPEKSVYERCLAAMRCISETWSDDMHVSSMHRAVATWVVQDHVDRRKPINNFLVSNTVLGIVAALNHRAKEDIVEAIVDRCQRRI